MRSRSSRGQRARRRAPGASRLTSGSSRPRLRRSVSTASAMPGYWTLTATVAAVARDGAVDLADRGGGERLLLELGEVLARPGRRARSRSSRSILAERQRRDVVAQRGERRLNSSRSDSGIAVKSTVESTWPIFIAAPRMWPSCSTSSRASAAARSPVAASARSGERTHVGGARAGPAQALAGDQAAEAAGAGQAGGGGRTAAAIPGQATAAAARATAGMTAPSARARRPTGQLTPVPPSPQ